MNFIDFCAGIGGARLGLERCGFKCVGFSEIDKAAIKSYEKFYDVTNEIKIGDLTTINPNALPNFDILTSGFPCQSFSIVGKREGLQNQDKGQIIYYLCDILKIKKPKYFILENVKGLVNHDKGNTLKIILSLLSDAGYNVDYAILNSLNFGLAQMRERIYFVGVKKDLNKDFTMHFQKLKNYKNNIDIKEFLTPRDENIILKDSIKFVSFCRYLNNKYNKNKFNINELLNKDYLIIDARQSDLRLYHNKIPTLRRDRQGIYYVYNKNLYMLSAIEALKLQGFGVIDNLQDKIANLKSSDILKQCGNAMSVNVMEIIANELKKFDK